ncbi:hypothetical protein DESC_740147 [Desulfosarcina cetonica]|nr:hypothetical protein DESC_740147 [Desulfosarcina cetonica]
MMESAATTNVPAVTVPYVAVDARYNRDRCVPQYPAFPLLGDDEIRARRARNQAKAAV